MTKDPIERLLKELEVCGCNYDQCLPCSVPRIVKEAICEIEAQYMQLPLDADGVPIRVGDKIEYPNGKRDVVRFITVNDNSPTFNECGWIAGKCRHVKSDTVESLLEEFAYIDGVELSKAVAEYAERIRKAVEHEQG